MKNTLENLILGNWGGIRLNANIDEELEDIILAIQYNDHGDDFLLIRTKDNTYEYGWWLNRPGYPEYDEIYNGKYDWQRSFIKRPELFYKFDNRCEFSNENCFKFNKLFEDSYNYIEGYRQHTVENAQRNFDKYIEYLTEYVEPAGIIYHHDDYREKLERYLKKHDIFTEENIDKMNEVKWNNRINGADGIAGKTLYEWDSLHGDGIEFIYYKGKKLDLRKIKMKNSYDSWGFETFRLSLKQFK